MRKKSNQSLWRNLKLTLRNLNNLEYSVVCEQTRLPYFGKIRYTEILSCALQPLAEPSFAVKILSAKPEIKTRNHIFARVLHNILPKLRWRYINTFVEAYDAATAFDSIQQKLQAAIGRKQSTWIQYES